MHQRFVVTQQGIYIMLDCHILGRSQRRQVHDFIRFCQHIKISAKLQQLGPAQADSGGTAMLFQYFLTLNIVGVPGKTAEVFAGNREAAVITGCKLCTYARGRRRPG